MRFGYTLCVWSRCDWCWIWFCFWVHSTGNRLSMTIAEFNRCFKLRPNWTLSDEWLNGWMFELIYSWSWANIFIARIDSTQMLAYKLAVSISHKHVHTTWLDGVISSLLPIGHQSVSSCNIINLIVFYIFGSIVLNSGLVRFSSVRFSIGLMFIK